MQQRNKVKDEGLEPKKFRLRSFVRRNSRETAGQERAFEELWPCFGLQLENGMIDCKKLFAREAETVLEIGFGTGQSLLEFARLHPDKNIIGVETHKPGIGALFQGVQTLGLSNLRVFYGDVIDVMQKCIPDNCLVGVQIFFPDPWPKRRHHARRLIQTEFIKLVIKKLQAKGTLHLATDWQDYSMHMMRVLSAETEIVNDMGINQFATRSTFRPIVSKFEGRALREGRNIWELQFTKS